MVVLHDDWAEYCYIYSELKLRELPWPFELGQARWLLTQKYKRSFYHFHLRYIKVQIWGFHFSFVKICACSILIGLSVVAVSDGFNNTILDSPAFPPFTFLSALFLASKLQDHVEAKGHYAFFSIYLPSYLLEWSFKANCKQLSTWTVTSSSAVDMLR